MAVKGKIKKKEGERLDDASIEVAIGMREREKPASIKDVCEFLRIANNGPRLAKIIQDYKDRKEQDKKLRAANRGKPASDFEVSTVVECYLRGDTLKEISDMLYRPVDFVKKIVERVGVPSTVPGEDYTNFNPLPEQCVADSFEVGEFVWSSKYGALAEIIRDAGVSSDGTESKVYQIYVYERIDWNKVETRYAFMPQGDFSGQYAFQRAYDLGSLRHLKPYIKDLTRMIK